MYAKVDIKHVREADDTGYFEVQITTPTFDENWRPVVCSELYYYGDLHYYPDAETALEAASEFYNGAVKMYVALSRGECDHNRAQLMKLGLEARKIDSQK